MRDYEFRGKAIKTGEWAYGCYVLDEQHAKPRHFIWTRENAGDFISNGMVEVDPATVGQFTGLTDKFGIRIYDGDILHERYHSENDMEIVWNEFAWSMKRLYRGRWNDAGTIENVCPTQNYVSAP